MYDTNNYNLLNLDSITFKMFEIYNFSHIAKVKPRLMASSENLTVNVTYVYSNFARGPLFTRRNDEIE